MVAFAIRLAVMPFLLDEQLDPARDHWKFGYETGRIARSIVEGRGFSSPLFEDTGRTAWMTPVYPYIVAGVFKVFGVYTKASAIVLVTSNALISALTCIPIFIIARKSFGELAARWSGWVWVLFPYAIYFPVERIWETWLATLMLCLNFQITLDLIDSEEKGESLWRWALWGFLWGVTALTSPAALIVLPFLACWLIYRRWQAARVWFVPNAIAATVFAVVISPWFIRNYEVFHRFVPFRDNMGLVLRLGVKAEGIHWAHYEVGPWHNDQEWEEFKREGELRYMDIKKQQALAAIRSDPGWWIWNSMRRAFFLWTGYWSFNREYLAQEPLDIPNIALCSGLTILALLGLRRALRSNLAANLPYALVLFSFPLIYYITSPEVYYRRPIDPFFVILAVAAFVPISSSPTKKAATG
jgi:4-amino-4-deoxy-L-arabinose transferase-like glycosyltransferase